MKKSLTAALVLALASIALAQQSRRWYGQPPYYWQGQQRTSELTVAQMRKLGLSEDQIIKICEKRRDLEKERDQLQKKLDAARQAAAAANAQAAGISRQLNSLQSTRLLEIYKSAMTEAQFKACRRLGYLEQARMWLRGYRSWLKLSDTQVEDIANLLVPVYEKYAAMSGELEDARRHLAELRRADKLDIQAIEEAEKQVAELSSRNVYQLRQQELVERMRPGLMPDQLERLDRVRRR